MLAFSPTHAATTLLLAGSLLATAGACAPSAAPATVPCTPAAGHYDCNWYVTGDGRSGGAPVVASSRALVGYLHKGSNWVVCQRPGAREASGGYYNNNWAWTLADDNRWGWVNAVYASGGDNNGAFGGGVPDCHNGHGQPPGGSPEAGSPAPQLVPETEVPRPAPAPSVPAQVPPPRPTTCGSAPGPGNNVTRWNPVVVCVLGMLGQPAGPDIVNAVDVLIEHESSGNPNAVNLWDSNARAGHPSKGLIQTIPTTFQANRSPVLANNVFDPAANIYAGLNYGINRYGSIKDIPGIRNVLNGGGYVGYASTQAKGLSRAGRCGSVKTGRLVLALSAKGVTCATARRAAKALDRSGTVRRATALVEGAQVRSGGRSYVCDVDGQGRHGARRAVFCQSGPRTLWWTARTR